MRITELLAGLAFTRWIETVAKLKGMLEAKGVKIFAVVDHRWRGGECGVEDAGY